MPKIVKNIILNVIALLLVFGFKDNIINALDIEKHFVLSDGKALIVSIVMSLLVLLYYIPIFLFEKIFNLKRLWITVNIAVLYLGFRYITNGPLLKFEYPIWLLFGCEIYSWFLLIRRDYFGCFLLMLLVMLLVILFPVLYPPVFFVLLLVEVIVIIIRKIKYEPQNVPSRLLTEQTTEIYNNTKHDVYKRHQTIKSTINNTVDFLSKNGSTSIAITGQWGSGKTSFKYEMQNLIKKNLVEDYIMFDFEAWACDNSQSIIKSFFSQYRKQIGRFIPKLNTVVKDYMYELLDEFGNNAFKIKHISKFIKEILGTDLEDNFAFISSALEKAKVRSYIFIDDLDRMQADEIIEVLKLVRNTANFPYTQFILFYDKEYIIQTITDKFTNADLYLEKIVNVEIPLSKIEGPVLVNSFWSKIEKDIKEYKDFVLGGYNDDKIKNDRSLLNVILSLVLNNERDVIKICNSIKIILDFYKSGKIFISYCDLVWLELVRTKYYKLYQAISNNPKILGMSNLFAPGSGVKVEIESDSEDENPFSEKTDDQTQKIVDLSQIASELYPNDDTVIALTKYGFQHMTEADNRYRYFKFGYSEHEFTVSDIKNNILGELKLDVTLWTLDNRYKSNLSLYKNYPKAINELLVELSEDEFKKLRENTYHSIKGDSQILPGDYETPAKTINLYKDLFKNYVEEWDYSTDVKKYDVLLTRQLTIISDCMDTIDRNTIINFLVKVLMNFQKRLDYDGCNISDFADKIELANQYDFIKTEINKFIRNIDVSILKDCIELVDFEHNIITKEDLQAIINDKDAPQMR